jgi:hypothetical protein
MKMSLKQKIEKFKKSAERFVYNHQAGIGDCMMAIIAVEYLYLGVLVGTRRERNALISSTYLENDEIREFVSKYVDGRRRK